MTLTRRTSPATRLSAELGRTIAPARPVRSQVGALVGIEHEFRVLLLGRPIDFRHVIHQLAIDGRRIDPQDPDAYRCTWGGTITADGPEAEIAIAPVSVGRDVAARTLARTVHGRLELERVLPAGAALEGYSTHISIAVPDALVDRAADRFVRHFSAAMTLLLDEPNSPGLLVRPRPGRLELGGEFADGDRLAVATVFAIGAVRASVGAVRRGLFAARHLPPALAVEPESAVERYGWFVGDAQLGVALHQDGRATSLALRDGRTMPAQGHLEAAWRAARRELGDLGAADLAAVDAVVAGGVDMPVGLAHAAQVAVAAPDPWSAAMRRRDRPGFAVDPVVLSWDFAVFRLSDATRSAYACLPRDVLGGALDALDAGRLDHLLRAYLATDEPSPRILASSAQTTTAGLYRGIGRVADLAGVERGPAGGGRDKRQRQDDRDQHDERDHRPDDQASSRRTDVSRTAKTAAGAGAAAGLTILGFPAAAAAAAIGVVGVVVVGGVLMLGGGSGSATPGSGQPGASLAAGASASALAPSASATESGLGIVPSPGLASPGPAAASPICDPWLAPNAIVATLGRSPTKVDGYNFLNGGQPVDCTWTFDDGSYLTLFALEQPEYGTPEDYLGVDGAHDVGGVDYVEGLGIVAFYDDQAGHPAALDWFPDREIALELITAPSGAAQVISREQLTAIAHLVNVPAVLPIAPAPS